MQRTKHNHNIDVDEYNLIRDTCFRLKDLITQMKEKYTKQTGLIY